MSEPEETCGCPTCGAIQPPIPEDLHLPKKGQMIRVETRFGYFIHQITSIQRIGNRVIVDLKCNDSLWYDIAKNKWQLDNDREGKHESAEVSIA